MGSLLADSAPIGQPNSKLVVGLIAG